MCVGALFAIFFIILVMNFTLSDYFPANEWNFEYKRTYYDEDSSDNYNEDSTDNYDETTDPSTTEFYEY